MNTEEIIDKLNTIELLLTANVTHEKEIMSFEETCRYLEVSSSYLYKLTSGKGIPHYVPTGKKIYFKRLEVIAWLLQNRKETKAELDTIATNYLIKNKRRIL